MAKSTKDKEETRVRKNTDEFGELEEEKTGGGYRILRRTIGGVTFKVYKPRTRDYLKAIEASGITLHLNDMSDRIELKPGAPITDFSEAEILSRLKDYGMPNPERMRESIKVMSNRNRYHPVRRYLDDLKWDDKDHFAAFINKLEMSSPLADIFWRKFLIGSIAKAIDAEQNFMLVLIGAQGKGKSRLCRWLCPVGGLFIEGPISPDNKDDHIKAMNHWLWEVAELDATTRRADRSALKNFISQKSITVRVPYGRYATLKSAAASFIGTINPDGTGFLSDPSGNRRFSVIQIDDIDWSYTDIDINQLWAQLYTAYKEGEPFELTYHEEEIQTQINSEHTSTSPLEEMLLRHYDLDPSDEKSFESSIDILAKLEMEGLKGIQRNLRYELGGIMTKHGISRKRQRHMGRMEYGYLGVKLAPTVTVKL